jgi:hypothetical protein
MMKSIEETKWNKQSEEELIERRKEGEMFM